MQYDLILLCDYMAYMMIWLHLLQLQETSSILDETNPEVVAGVRIALRRAGQVCCYGPGREGLVLKAFATRLHQLGIKVTNPQSIDNAFS